MKVTAMLVVWAIQRKHAAATGEIAYMKLRVDIFLKINISRSDINEALKFF
jgi:hypothetical protein